jgi:hypothetical protein
VSDESLKTGVCSKFGTPEHLLNDIFVKPKVAFAFGLLALLLDLSALLYVLIFVEQPRGLGPTSLSKRK